MDYAPVSEALVEQAVKILRDNERIRNIPVNILENNRFSCAHENIFQQPQVVSANLEVVFRKWNTVVYRDSV